MYNGAVPAKIAYTLSMALVFTFGCNNQGVKRSILGIDLGDREVNVAVDGPAFISKEGERAVVDFQGRQLAVEQDRLLLDGREQAKLPAQAKLIEVEFIDGKLDVTADGVAVSTSGADDPPR